MQTSDQVGDNSTNETQETSSAAQTLNVAAPGNEPIIITGGSIEIDLNNIIFPPDPVNPNRHKNAGKKLKTLTIWDKASPPSTIVSVDLSAIDGGKCMIVVEYD